jgi:hypothetical protein
LIKKYHAVMGAIVITKTIVNIVPNIHILMNSDLDHRIAQVVIKKYSAVTDATVVTKMILNIVPNIPIQTNNYYKLSLCENLISTNQHERVFLIRNKI